MFALLSVTTVTLYDLYRAGCDWLDWKAMVFGAVIVQFSREFFERLYLVSDLKDDP